jgi:hypothetical protein
MSPAMRRFVRWAPASDVLAAVALALTGLIAPPPPVAGTQAADIVAYYARHRVGLEIESVADGVGGMLLVMFAATFHARIRSIPSLTAFVTAAIVAACMLVQVAAFQALAFRPNPRCDTRRPGSWLRAPSPTSCPSPHCWRGWSHARS